MNKLSRPGQASRPPAALSDGTVLTREAQRLLEGLAREGANARPDPADDDRLILRAGGGAVSLGGGSFRRAAADLLVRHDLAAREGARVVATAAGRARQRRTGGGADGFQAQHRETVTVTVATEAGPARVGANAAESPLDWLRRRRDRDGSPLIDAAAFEAGERLRRDVTAAGLLPGVTQRWEAAPGGGSGGPAAATDRVIAARQRLRAALVAVGPDFADLLLDLCGFLKGLETLERERGWPARSAKVVVRLALARLADHYGLAREARGPAASRGIRAWIESAPENIRYLRK